MTVTLGRRCAAGPARRLRPGAGAVGMARAVRGAALAAGLVAALAAPAAASAAPRRAAAKLKAASAPASELRQVAAIPLPGGATVYRFQQRISGVKVLNGQAVVSDPAGAPPGLVADSSKPGIERSACGRESRRRRAIAIASRGADVRRVRGQRSASLAIAPGDGGTLVWRVVIPSARPLGDFEVLVDAVSGAWCIPANLLQRLQPRPREALRPESGGRATQLLRGPAKRPPRPQHPAADLAARFR